MDGAFTMNDQARVQADGTDEERLGPLRIGSRLRKYEIVELIGQGGYASVYKARDTIFHRDVAIKVIHRIGGVTEDMMRRGQAEAAFLNKIRHPNIVEVFDADLTSSGLLYIVMELLVGRSLYEVLREHQRLAVEETLGLAIQVAEAVDAAHRLGAIHRDLKPENIFVTANNVIKVLDFGIAKFVNDVAAKTTAKDALQGSVLYMSPEHVQGIRVGPRTDIYALGLIMYRALFGEHPVLMDLEQPTAWAVASWHIHTMPRPICDLVPQVPRYVSRLISSSCAKDPRDRPESMASTAAQTRTVLERFLRENQGELKGKSRDLSHPLLSTEPRIDIQLPKHPAQFVPFQPSEQVSPPDSLPQPAKANTTVPGTGLPSPVVAPPVPAVITVRTPPVVPPPASVTPRSVPPKPKPSLRNYWLIASALSGAIVFGGATKGYFIYRRSTQPAPAPELSAVAVTPSTPVVVEITAPPIVETAPAPAASIAPPPVVTAAAHAVVVPKPKKLNASEQRLKALEDELNRRQKSRQSAITPIFPAEK